jgi:hypothetical protein
LQIILDTLSHAHIQKACKEKKKDPKKMSSETRKQVVRDEQRRQGIKNWFYFICKILENKLVLFL